MTMQFVAKFYAYPGSEQMDFAKEALEQIKRDVIRPRDTCLYPLAVTEADEETEYTYYPDGVTPAKGKSVQHVVKIEGYVHFHKVED